MDTREYFHLQPGDVIQNLGSGSTYIVVEGYRTGIGNPVIALAWSGRDIARGRR